MTGFPCQRTWRWQRADFTGRELQASEAPGEFYFYGPDDSEMSMKEGFGGPLLLSPFAPGCWFGGSQRTCQVSYMKPCLGHSVKIFIHIRHSPGILGLKRWYTRENVAELQEIKRFGLEWEEKMRRLRLERWVTVPLFPALAQELCCWLGLGRGNTVGWERGTGVKVWAEWAVMCVSQWGGD